VTICPKIALGRSWADYNSTSTDNRITSER
jgi:hypothetical protein